MNSRLTIGQLANNIARIAGCDLATAEKYLKVLSEEITARLIEGQSVTVKHIGTFKPNKDDAEEPVKFVPDPNLAALINAPFEMFEAVQLHDSVTDDMLNDIDKQLDITEKNIDDNTGNEDVNISTEPSPELATTSSANPLVTSNEESLLNGNEKEKDHHDNSPQIDLPKDQIENKLEVKSIVTSVDTEDTSSPKENTSFENQVETESDEVDEEIIREKNNGSHNWALPLLIGFIAGILIGAIVTFWYVTDQIDKARAPYLEELESVE